MPGHRTSHTKSTSRTANRASNTNSNNHTKSASRTDLITVKDLTLAYGTNTVIQNANFNITTGHFYCLVGANGSGKSTLVKALLGLLKPVSGSITYAPALRQTTIGYLPQETKIDANFPATVQEIVLSGTLGHLGHRPFYRPAEKTLVEKSLHRLGITSLQHQSFSSLSGGQKQKVLLARALAATSQLLILDEPSNNLDYPSRQDFYRTLAELNHTGLTIIMITHDLDTDDLIGSHVVALKNGHVKTTTTSNFLRGFRR